MRKPPLTSPPASSLASNSRSLHFCPQNSSPVPQWHGQDCRIVNHSAISEVRHHSLKHSCPSLSIKTNQKTSTKQSGLAHRLQLALPHSIIPYIVRFYTRVLDCRNHANSYYIRTFFHYRHHQINQHSISHRNCHRWIGSSCTLWPRQSREAFVQTCRLLQPAALLEASVTRFCHRSQDGYQRSSPPPKIHSSPCRTQEVRWRDSGHRRLRMASSRCHRLRH